MKKLITNNITQYYVNKKNTDAFVVGYNICSDNEWLLMHDISPEGHLNGLALYMQSDIVSICSDSDYLKRIRTLVNFWSEPIPAFTKMQDNPLISALTYAHKNKYILGIELLKSGQCDVYGIIENIDEQVIRIQQIDYNGYWDGISFIEINAITRCFINDSDAICLKALLESHNTKN